MHSGGHGSSYGGGSGRGSGGGSGGGYRGGYGGSGGGSVSSKGTQNSRPAVARGGHATPSEKSHRPLSRPHPSGPTEDDDLARALAASLAESEVSVEQHRPLDVHSPAPVMDLFEEYERGSCAALYDAKLKALSVFYRAVRRIRGEGNCFYRSFWMGWIERMLEENRQRGSSATSASGHPLLANPASDQWEEHIVALSDRAAESFRAAGAKALEEELIISATPGFIEVTRGLCRGYADGGEPGLLTKARETDQTAKALRWLRLIASAHMRGKEEDFGIIAIGMRYDSLRAFCDAQVEADCSLADEPQITALTGALGIAVKVEYLDDGPQRHVIRPLGPPIAACVLFRPGHYDLLIPRNWSEPDLIEQDGERLVLPQQPPRPPPLLDAEDGFDEPAATTPLQRLRSLSPRVTISFDSAIVPPTPDSPSQIRRKSFTITIESPRKLVEFARRRGFKRLQPKTTITIDLRLAQGLLLLLLLLPVVSGLAIGKAAPASMFGRTHAAASARLGWVAAERGGVAAPVHGVWDELTENNGLRVRLGLVQLCLGAEHRLEALSNMRGAATAKHGLQRWLMTRASDAACSLTFPTAYGEVKRWHAIRSPAARSALDEATAELQAALKAALPHGSHFTLQARVKSSTSLFEKLVLRNKERVDDVLGLRVVLDDDDDNGAAAGTVSAADGCAARCQLAADAVLSLWSLSRPLKDYIAHPKPNGYRSMHLNVRLRSGMLAEVQVRTRCMHETAERGSAAHGLYKCEALGSCLARR